MVPFIVVALLFVFECNGSVPTNEEEEEEEEEDIPTKGTEEVVVFVGTEGFDGTTELFSGNGMVDNEDNGINEYVTPEGTGTGVEEGREIAEDEGIDNDE